MIDPNEVIQNFKENFEKMSYEEREAYLKDMGFTFGAPRRSRKTVASTKNVHFATRSRAQVSHITMARYAAKRKNKESTIRVGARAAKSKV